MTPHSGSHRSKTLTTWLALVGGIVGLHRLYLYGFKDAWAWLHAVPTLIGIYGIQRVQQLGQDDKEAWVLVPLLGIMVAIAMFSAIRYGLTPDEKWNARFNGGDPRDRTGWLTIAGVAIALLIGSGTLMATIAFSGQRYFEYQIEAAQKLSQ